MLRPKQQLLRSIGLRARRPDREFLLVTAALLISVAMAAGQTYDLAWHTVDGGGAGPSNASTGGTYTLSSTIGQSDARNHPEPMTGGNYRLTGGFWVIPECPAIAADYDGDCDVDQGDYVAFEACASGPGILQADPDYAWAHFDEDDDVDQSDFSVFQRCFSGEDVPANLNCAE